MRKHEKICNNFMWQIHLLKNWRASFYVTNKNCHMWEFVRVHNSPHKMWHAFSKLAEFHYEVLCYRVCLRCSESFLTHMEISFQFVVPCTCANVFVTEKLSQKICSCGCGLMINFMFNLEGQHCWYSGMQYTTVSSIPSSWIHGVISWHWNTDGSVDCCQHQPAYQQWHECMVTWYGKWKG